MARLGIAPMGAVLMSRGEGASSELDIPTQPPPISKPLNNLAGNRGSLMMLLWGGQVDLSSDANKLVLRNALRPADDPE